MPRAPPAISFLLFWEIKTIQRKFYYIKNTAALVELVEDHPASEIAFPIKIWVLFRPLQQPLQKKH